MAKLARTVLAGGFVFYGGLLGALAGNVIFCKVRKYNLDDVMDFTVPAFALFHAFGRVGCFFGGCCYGFKFSGPVYFGNLFYLNYFPMQLVEAAFELIMFFLLKKAPEGKTLKIYLLSYGVFRFVNEFFRGDAVRGIWFGMSTSQWISLIIIAVYLCLTVRKAVMSRKRSNA